MRQISWTTSHSWCSTRRIGQTLNERTLHGIESLQKVKFDPAAIGNEARRKLMLSQFIRGWDNGTGATRRARQAA